MFLPTKEIVTRNKVRLLMRPCEIVSTRLKAEEIRRLYTAASKKLHSSVLFFTKNRPWSLLMRIRSNDYVQILSLLVALHRITIINRGNLMTKRGINQKRSLKLRTCSTIILYSRKLKTSRTSYRK